MSAPLLLLVGTVAAAALVVVVPRVFLGRAQDRLAASLLEGPASSFKLLTRAELCAGKYRRLPGVLGLAESEVVFRGIFGESEVVPTSRIQKIITGSRLSSGRRLLRREALRLTRASGGELEFVLARDSASAWRSHLGLWAVNERRAAMDTVTPGRR